jgi:hypothetical protein
MNWINLAEDRVYWRAIVNKVNESLGSKKGGQFLGQLSDYRLLYSTELLKYKLHAFLTTAVHGGDWSASFIDRLTILRLVGGLQSRSRSGGENKNSCPCRESNSGRPSHS